MDIGIVASRYAKALLRFSSHNQEEQLVYAEMKQLHRSYLGAPQLAAALGNPTMGDKEKGRLLRTASLVLQRETSSQSTAKFIDLVTQQKRTHLMPFIATSFLSQYERSKGMTSAQLWVATPIGEQTEQRLKDLVAQRTKDNDVHLTVSLDPSLEAGFVLEYDDYRMDASLRGQFERLRRQFKK